MKTAIFSTFDMELIETGNKTAVKGKAHILEMSQPHMMAHAPNALVMLKSEIQIKASMVVHTCNPSIRRRGRLISLGSRPAWSV